MVPNFTKNFSIKKLITLLFSFELFSAFVKSIFYFSLVLLLQYPGEPVTNEMLTFVGHKMNPPSLVRLEDYLEDGFLFPDSSDKKITKTELYELSYISDCTMEELLIRAKREIYARHVRKKRYDSDYSGYAWYDCLEYGKISKFQLSETERANLDLIGEVQEESGLK